MPSFGQLLLPESPESIHDPFLEAFQGVERVCDATFSTPIDQAAKLKFVLIRGCTLSSLQSCPTPSLITPFLSLNQQTEKNGLPFFGRFSRSRDLHCLRLAICLCSLDRTPLSHAGMQDERSQPLACESHLEENSLPQSKDCFYRGLNPSTISLVSC